MDLFPIAIVIQKSRSDIGYINTSDSIIYLLYSPLTLFPASPETIINILEFEQNSPYCVSTYVFICPTVHRLISTMLSRSTTHLLTRGLPLGPSRGTARCINLSRAARARPAVLQSGRGGGRRYQSTAVCRPLPQQRCFYLKIF